MPMAAPPIVISIKAIPIKTNFKESSPKHTPFDRGTILQNLGSLYYSSKMSKPVNSSGLC